ncbi:MAG: mechanosensitive ion channel family protein [Microcystaceae cyanobacterium]
MSPTNQAQDISYLWRQIDKISIFLERPKVQWQLLIIGAGLLLALVLYRWFWFHLKQKFPQLLTLWQRDQPIRDKQYGLVLIIYMTQPLLNIAIIFSLLKLWQYGQFTYGLINVALEFIILHTLYRLFSAVLFLLFPPIIVRKYQLSFWLPIFLILIFIRLINLTSDFNSLLSVSILNLFGSPISLGAIFLSSIGLYLWLVGVGIFEHLLLPFLIVSDRLQTGTAEAMLILVRYFLIGLGIVLIFGYVGFNPTAFAAITGGLSVGLGFALKEVFSNFISGILLLSEGVLRPGDLINIEGDTAEIKKLGVRATTVKMLKDNSEKIVPNQLFFTEILTTFTGSDRLARDFLLVGVSYNTNPQQVMEILLAMAKAHPHILSEPEPLVYIVEFASSSINFKLNFYVNDPGLRQQVKSDLSQEIWNSFRENQIEIPFPQRDIYIKELPVTTSQNITQKEDQNKLK